MSVGTTGVPAGTPAAHAPVSGISEDDRWTGDVNRPRTGEGNCERTRQQPGIMMTRGRGEDGRFREWLIADIRARTGYGSPLGWESIIMQERFADLAPSPSQAPHPDVLDPEQNQESD